MTLLTFDQRTRIATSPAVPGLSPPSPSKTPPLFLDCDRGKPRAPLSFSPNSQKRFCKIQKGCRP